MEPINKLIREQAYLEEREELEPRFSRGELPLQQHFYALIHNPISRKDDGIFKSAEHPLCIQSGPEKDVLHFYDYEKEGDSVPDWKISIANGLSIGNGTENQFTIMDTGKIGMGTDHPQLQLEVGGEAPSLGVAKSTNQWLALQIGPGVHAIGWDRDADLLFGVQNNKGERITDGVKITKDGHLVVGGRGNFGIGIDNPIAAKMQVAGDIVLGNAKKNERFILHPRHTHKGDFLQITSDDGNGKWGWGKGITLRRDGKVGIGTTTPTRALTVKAQRPRIALVENGGNAGVLEFNESTDELRFQWWDQYGARYKKTIMSMGINGNIGIGIASPADTLQMASSATFRIGPWVLRQSGGGDSTSYFHFDRWSGNTYQKDRMTIDYSGHIRCKGTFVGLSDKRLKKEINPFKDGLETIEQFKPVTFKFNGLANTNVDQKEIGIIAQDLQDVAPYLIYKFKDKLNPEDTVETEILHYNPTAITFLLINAVKELSQKLTSLQKKIARQGSD